MAFTFTKALENIAKGHAANVGGGLRAIGLSDSQVLARAILELQEELKKVAKEAESAKRTAKRNR